jgi:hypothetical protein
MSTVGWTMSNIVDSFSLAYLVAGSPQVKADKDMRKKRKEKKLTIYKDVL